MNVDEMTIADAMDTLSKAAKVAEALGRVTVGAELSRSHSIEVGKAVLIRTVTMYYTGRVEVVTDSDIVLSNAAWIADVGRYSTALREGKLNEVEPYPDGVVVGRAGVIDIAPWTHDLPRDVK